MFKIRNFAVLVAAMTIVSAAGTVSAVTVIQDSFNRVGDLNGSMPDVGIVPWTTLVPATQKVEDSVLKMIDGSAIETRASLGFDFVPGLVYTLSVDIDIDDGGDRSWMAIGFTNNLPEGIKAWGADIYPWALLRSEDQNPTPGNPIPDDFATFLTDPYGARRQDVSLSPFANSGKVEIVLDTTDLNDYQVRFSFNDVPIRTVNYGSAPAITGVFVSAYKQLGTFDNLLLWDDTFGGIPEPTTMCLLAFGGLAVLKRRRKA